MSPISSLNALSGLSFPVYGLTGGIASGKSVVARVLRELGIEVLDADAIARELRAPGGEASDLILSEFGTLDGSALRARIANRPEDKKRLESILHPRIVSESQRRFSEIENRSIPHSVPYVVYEAALLVETGRAKDFAGLILVESDVELQLSRLVSRDGMDPKVARQFLGVQAPIEPKRAAASHHLLNNGTLDELREKVKALHAALLRQEKSFSA